MRKLFVLVGLFLLISFSPAHGQRCGPYSLNFLSGFFCVGRLPYPIYSPLNKTQNQAYQPILEQLFAGQSIEGAGLDSGLATVSPSCTAAVLSLICGVFVPGKFSFFFVDWDDTT